MQVEVEVSDQTRIWTKAGEDRWLHEIVERSVRLASRVVFVLLSRWVKGEAGGEG